MRFLSIFYIYFVRNCLPYNMQLFPHKCFQSKKKSFRKSFDIYFRTHNHYSIKQLLYDNSSNYFFLLPQFH